MNIVTAVVSILIAQGAGLLGSLFTAPNIQGWYNTLSKPTWNPPSWLFGPAWFILYTLMGVAAAIIWEQKDTQSIKLALTVYGIQLALNALWSILFFGLNNPGIAFAEILVLWVAILATLILFWRISPTAGALLIPYLAWVTFAAALNFAIWKLN